MTSLLALALLACGGSTPAPTPDQASPAAVEEAPAAEPEAAAEEEVPVSEVHKNIFKPVTKPTPAGHTKDLVDLGRMLYYEPRLSLGQDISCNSCHDLMAYGVDGKPTSPGHKGQLGARNSPSSYFAFAHVAQFWDGRAKTVEEQALGPITNPVEMAMPDLDTVVALLDTIPGYQTAFAKAFPSQTKPITAENIGRAIGAFERNLVTPGRWDEYLGGKGSALTPEERAGADLFVSTGCISCHNGAFLGGNSFQKLGAVEPYETADEGRKEVTGEEADLHVFKVPSLRNVAKTGPWFHDGSVATLEEAVKLMARHQLGKLLTDEEAASITTFLGALTGTIDKAYVVAPALPPGGPETPGPKE
ncbi:MAG: c-type cytochrome [Alphaproteobacteria bacterium]|nr:c-type cytochrome [Alphaproteobacteria bacterium]